MSSLSQRGSEVAQKFCQNLQKGPSAEISWDLMDFRTLSSPFPWKDLAAGIWPKFEFSGDQVSFCGFEGGPLPLEDSVYAILGSLQELFSGKSLATLMDFPFRELENFLRDYNHRPTWSGGEDELNRWRDFLRDEKVLLGIQSLVFQRGTNQTETLFDSRDLVEEVTFLKNWTGNLASLRDPLNVFSPAKDLDLFDVNDQEVVFSLSARRPLGAAQNQLWEAIWREYLRLSLSSSFELRGRKLVAEARQMT